MKVICCRPIWIDGRGPQRLKALEIGEEEAAVSAVVNFGNIDGATEAISIVILPQRGKLGARGVKERPRIIRVISVELEERPVKTVASRLCAQVDLGRRSPYSALYVVACCLNSWTASSERNTARKSHMASVFVSPSIR